MSAPKHDLGYRVVPKDIDPPALSWWACSREEFAERLKDQLPRMAGSHGDRIVPVKPVIAEPPTKFTRTNPYGVMR